MKNYPTFKVIVDSHKSRGRTFLLCRTDALGYPTYEVVELLEPNESIGRMMRVPLRTKMFDDNYATAKKCFQRWVKHPSDDVKRSGKNA